MTIKDDFRAGPSAASDSVSPQTDEDCVSAEFDAEEEQYSDSIFGLRPPIAKSKKEDSSGSRERDGGVSSRARIEGKPGQMDMGPQDGGGNEKDLGAGVDPFLSDGSAPFPQEPCLKADGLDSDLSSQCKSDFEALPDLFSYWDDAETEPLRDLPDDPDSFESQEHDAASPVLQQRPSEGAKDSGPGAGSEAVREARWLGVRFSKNGQVYYVPDQELQVRKGTKVLVKQENGPVLGEVASILEGRNLLPGKDISSHGSVILGVATAQDIARHTENSILSDEAEAFCKTCIRQRELDMKLVDVEVLHDRSKIIFYFTAPARIDFRELVKDLVRNYRTRIELRQIGVRHESQMIGGLGNCGMVCCCHRYLRKFAPVTIKMAKEQNLFLNPAKLSGMCGRLLCCLSFEQGNYEEFNRRCPKIGKKYVTAEKGTVKILRANMFSQTICVHSENGEEWEFTLEEWDNMHPRRTDPGQHPEAGRGPEHAQAEDGGKRAKKPWHRGEAAQSSRTEENASRPAQGQEDAALSRRNNGRPRPHKRDRQKE